MPKNTQLILILEMKTPKEFGNITLLSGQQDGIIQANNKGFLTPNSSNYDYIKWENVNNNFLLDYDFQKQNTILPNISNIPCTIKNMKY